MNGVTLQDRIWRGMGVAARHIGSPYAVFRPRDGTAPLGPRNKIITLNAAFSPGDGRFQHGPGYGDTLWAGALDAAYTAPGDYLQGPAGVFFIACQLPLLPLMCVKTNRVVTVTRQAAVQSGGYSGVTAAGATVVLSGWPASVVALTTRASGSLPETRFGNWSVLLPALPAALPGALQVADIVLDDEGRVFMIGAAEASDLGWRLTVREVAG
jgi:hypothetical protein